MSDINLGSILPFRSTSIMVTTCEGAKLQFELDEKNKETNKLSYRSSPELLALEKIFPWPHTTQDRRAITPDEDSQEKKHKSAPPQHGAPQQRDTPSSQQFVDAYGNFFENDCKLDELNSQIHLGHLVWLYYHEKMGIFSLLGRILDDYASNGAYAISSGINASDIPIALELMVRNTKKGIASTVRDRKSTYLRALGWDLDGQPSMPECSKNSAFSDLFIKFMKAALAYFAEKRLVNTMTGSVTKAPSIATEQSVKDAANSLKNSFIQFDYGRCKFNTFNGILWAIFAMGSIRQLRDSIGIPTSLNAPEQYISAAFDVLVDGKSAKPNDGNRYTVHFECANYGFNILDRLIRSSNWILEPEFEKAVEGYRSSYYRLTNIDLAPPKPTKN